ncbi:MAG: TlpA family protein disulfide reductase [Frankiales bacterium]|nr:MAG: TlpA family protein disulfide reductase [Frankiales bacterium]
MTDNGSVLRRPTAVAAALACVLALTACSGESAATDGAISPTLKTVDGGENGLIAEGDRPPAPDLSGTTLDGERLDVADYRGKVVVLNFWASWCPPCRAEAPNLIEVAEQTEADGVQFIGVNVKNAKDEALAFERKQGVPYPSLHDQPGVLLTRFRKLVPQVPPTTLLLDREGRIAGRFIGGVTTRELLIPVQALAAETP